jgi:hypothetical protein
VALVPAARGFVILHFKFPSWLPFSCVMLALTAELEQRETSEACELDVFLIL